MATAEHHPDAEYDSGRAQGDSDEVGSDTAQDFVRHHPALVKLGRVGWLAKGIVYALTGVLALTIAAQSAGTGSGAGGSGSNNEASQSGAIATIAEQPAGAALLVAIAAGLALYVLWRLVTVILPAENSVTTWVTRGGYLVSAFSYIALGWSALSFARNPGSSDGSEDAKVDRYTRTLMEMTAGRYLVFVLGAGVIGVGAYFVSKSVTSAFEEDLDGRPVGPLSHDGLLALGRVGWAGRGVMMGLIGFFLVRSAIVFDPERAEGLDGSLRTVAGGPAGTALIAVVALSLIVYGTFCALSAPRRRLTGAD